MKSSAQEVEEWRGRKYEARPAGSFGANELSKSSMIWGGDRGAWRGMEEIGRGKEEGMEAQRAEKEGG